VGIGDWKPERSAKLQEFGTQRGSETSEGWKPEKISFQRKFRNQAR
jgi:hypothetical protein